MLLCALVFFWYDGNAVEVDGDPNPGTREDELGVREDENMVLRDVHQDVERPLPTNDRKILKFR
jgi:hypothetical protein